MKTTIKPIFSVCIILAAVVIFSASVPSLRKDPHSTTHALMAGKDNGHIINPESYRSSDQPLISGRSAEEEPSPESSITRVHTLVPRLNADAGHVTSPGVLPESSCNSAYVDELQPVFLSLGEFLLTGEPGIVPAQTELSVEGLAYGELPDIEPWMINVTGTFAGYRLLPHTEKFTGELKLHIPYDSLKIPTGYSPKDIRTWYYHEQQKKWMTVPYDSLDAEACVVISRTDHFTDFVNAIIQTPEAPQTNAYTPTMMKDIQFANPFDGYNVIAPPTANNQGTANLQFPIEVPPGRQGMQPNLAITYSSEGGNGWMGVGWDMKIPSVNVETRWGVPRYDPDYETESYLLAGEQLMPMVHKDTLQKRSIDGADTLHPRVEGAFNRIIRHGTTPADYWWEVTDRNGIVYYYGKYSDPSIQNPVALCDTNGNIASWPLAETRDLYGNFVRYYYRIVYNKGLPNGTVSGKQLYPDHITYTGFDTTEGPYKVQFVLDDGNRPDIIISGRNGFKEVTAHRLDSIMVMYNTDTVRCYVMLYKEGSFKRTLLCSLLDFSSEGLKWGNDPEINITCDSIMTTGPDRYKNLPGVRIHRFNYYHEDIPDYLTPCSLGVAAYVADSMYTVIGTPKSFSLSSTISNDYSGSGSIGIGFGGNFIMKNLSFGGDFNYTYSESTTRVTFMDINGDGLPDRIYKKDNDYKYRPLRWSGGKLEFDTQQYNITGLSCFGKEYRHSHSFGIEGTCFAGGSGNWNNSNTHIPVYFSDVNADGLPDLVKEGKVYFNRVEGDSTISFFIPSGDTVYQPGNPCNYIIYNGMIDPEIDTFPATDIPPLEYSSVRMWMAPFTGEISIDAPIQLFEDTSFARKISKRVNGIRYHIQHNNNMLVDDTILPDDYVMQNLDAKTINVNKGDHIYFRLNSMNNRQWDHVFWNPDIHYTVPDNDKIKDADNLKPYRYIADQDFLLYQRQVFMAPDSGDVHVKGKIITDHVSDSVCYKLIHDNTVIKDTTIADDTYNEYKIDVHLTGIDSLDMLNLYAFTSTNVDWNKIHCDVEFIYTSAKNLDIDTTEQYRQIRVKPMMHRSLYQNQITPVLPNKIQGYASVDIIPKISYQSAVTSSSVMFAVKKSNKVIAKKQLPITNNKISLVDSLLHINLNDPDTLFFEFCSTDTNLFGKISMTEVEIGGETHPAGFSLPYADSLMKFGNLYRGWGQFSYLNPPGNYIDPSLLYIPEPDPQAVSSLIDTTNLKSILDTNDLEGSYNDFSNSAENAELYNPQKNFFSPMYPDMDSLLWRGFGDVTMVGPYRMSNERKKLLTTQIEYDSPIIKSVDGEKRLAINKQIISDGHSFNINGGIGPLSLGYSWSSGTNTSNADFFDMNGDRFPDVIIDNNIQYTLPHGGLDYPAIKDISDFLGINKGSYDSKGMSMGMGFPEIARANTKSTKTTSHQMKMKATTSSTAGVSNSTSDISIADMNGDGLPDLIQITNQPNKGYVALNVGYGFTAYEPWSFDTISYSTSINAGVSSGSGVDMEFDNCYASWTAGVGGSVSENHPYIFMNDVNGDGLSDIVLTKNNATYAALNNGNGFLSPVIWINDPLPNKNKTYSLTGNMGGTIGFPIYSGIKLNISLGGSYSPSFSVDKAQFADINNDGYPDMIYLDNGQVMIRYSTLGRINMLKEVSTPTFSTYNIEYEMMLCDADMPQRKWVMSGLTVHSGVDVDCGADSMLTAFEYKNGYYDRYDREFYGYDTVITTQYQTYNTASPYKYRSTIETFHNRDYLFKGLKTSEVLRDSTDKKITRTKYTWHRKEINSGYIIPDDSAHCFGPYYPAISAEDRYYFEDQQTYQIHTRKEYVHGPFGNITQYTNLGDTAVNGDSIVATITYINDTVKHILGLPDTMIVTDGTQELRKRYAAYDPNTGKLTQIVQMNGNQSSIIDILYYANGNLHTLKMPTDDQSFRKELYYSYDIATSTYPDHVYDNLAYNSFTSYDLRFGVPIMTEDVSGNVIEYTYDDFGRMRTVLAPYEADANTPWTIRFSFWDDNSNDVTDTSLVPWAITEHYDTMNTGNKITTSTFADGLGRALQTKKSSVVYENGQASSTWIVSGTVYYDGLGRTVKTWQPITDNILSADDFVRLTDTLPPSLMAYDAMDRQTIVWIPSGASSYVTNTSEYVFGTDDNGYTRFKTVVTDANQVSSEQYTDPRGLKIMINNANLATTKFVYNAMGELIESIDPEDDATTYTYDMLGRVVERSHPDAGTTTWRYDDAGNLRSLQTANLAGMSDSITYNYTYGRLIQIHYPLNPEMDVYYEYGGPSAGNQAGRITRQQDASGVQQFLYGKLGEQIKNERTFVLPGGSETYTFAMEWEYDSWNRIKQMTYPDGEVVTYDYDVGGQLIAMQGEKNSTPYPIIDTILYDKFGARAYIVYGNGTKTRYEYEPYRRRLDTLKTFDGDQQMLMNLGYSYDNESNITGISNSAGAVNGLGGVYSYTFGYDDMYRLTSASGSFKNKYNYTLSMSYSTSGNITNKTLEALTLYAGGVEVPVDYDATYNYNPGRPHAIDNISGTNADHEFLWDENGNMTRHANNTAGLSRMLCWDEENRLTAVRDENNMSAYIYDAGGERVWKLTGQVQKMYIDGIGLVDLVDMNNKTLYASPYLVFNETGYSKHYYAGAERVSSRIGGGMDDALVDPLNYAVEILSGQDYTAMAGDLLDMLHRNIECTDMPMQYVSMEERLASVEDSRNHNNVEDNRYIYHSDHLGSSSFLTDATGDPTQHLQYLPFGEPFIDQRTDDGYATPYTFSAKERDPETGYSYFGARYYSSNLSIWLSVDPMADKRSWVSPYLYCQNNPIGRIDPIGALDDNYTVDELGKIIMVEKTTDEFDVLYTKDSWDNGKKDNSITVEKGILNKKYSQSVKDPRDNTWYKYDVLKIRGDDKAKKLFEFIAKNSKVEWSRSMVGVEGDNGLNYLTTTHLEGIEYGGGHLYRTQLITYTYRGNDHCHNNNSTTVSDADVGFATEIQKLHPNAKFNIFTPMDGKYTPFDKNTIPGLLRTFIVTPKD